MNTTIDAERIREARRIQEKNKKNKIYSKPPLGCYSFKLNTEERIQDLSNAIQRYITANCFNEQSIKNLRNWAKELNLQCELWLKMNREYIK